MRGIALSRRQFTPLPAFLPCYLLGLAWGCVHVGMELHGGFGLRKVGLPLSLASIVLLAFLVRGQQQRWALPAAIVLGAVESYYVAIAHFVPDRNTTWRGPLPWLTTADVTAPGWSFAYKVLIDVGLLIGLAILWVGVRAMITRFGRHEATRFIVLCTGVMFALGLSRFGVNDGLWGMLGIQWILGIGLVPLAVMLLSLRSMQRPRPVANSSLESISR